MQTAHALQRAAERIGAKVDTHWAQLVAELAELLVANYPGEHVAIRLGRVPFVGEPWSDESNGDEVIAIGREGRVVTFMFRRRTQPFTPVALRVNKCIDTKQCQGDLEVRRVG